MNDSGHVTFTDLSATEIELDAQDLLGLDPLPASEPRASTHVATTDIEPAPPAASPAASPPQAPSKRSITTQHLAWAAGVIVAVAVGVGATNNFSSSQPQRSAEVAWSTIPDKPVADPEPVLEEEAPPPLLVKNPFDDSEVFELPAGTSEADARDMVAELLLKRAAERQANLNSRTARR